MKISERTRGILIKAAALVCLVLLVLFTKTAAWAKIVNVFKPVIYGGVLAYLLWPVMAFSEETFLFGIKSRKLRRACALIIVYAVFMLVITLFIIGILPQLGDSFTLLQSRISGYVIAAQDLVNRLPEGQFEFLSAYQDQISEYLSSAVTWVWTTLRGVISNATFYISRFLSGAKNIIFGLFVSVYFMLFKEHLFAQFKKLAASVFTESVCDRCVHYICMIDEAFGGFLKGKLLDSIIIGALCGAAMTVLGMPYVLIISTIIGVTNMIPVIGPFIGAIPSALIIFIAEPSKTIPFLVLILVLQQLDGNIIGPKILSSFTSLDPLWIIIAVTVMSGLLGTFGMFLGVPTFASIYVIVKELAEERLASRGLPVATAEYYTDPSAVSIVKSEKKPKTKKLKAEE